MAGKSSSWHVVVIGGGATGAGLAHDLSLRGVRVTLLERGELTSGTTGRHHGLLHSGGRYAVLVGTGIGVPLPEGHVPDRNVGECRPLHRCGAGHVRGDLTDGH